MPGADVSEYPLRPCNHEEFDTRVMLPAVHTDYCERHLHNRTSDIVLQ